MDARSAHANTNGGRFGFDLAPRLFEWVRPWSSALDIRCGSLRPPPNPPFDASLYPFTTLTKLDYEGYPNFRDKRLEASLSLAPQGWYVGYEDGEFVRAASFTAGRRLQWTLEFELINATHADTFVEFVVEPNPRAGQYEGPDRARCSTRALGEVWSGARRGVAQFEVLAIDAQRFQVNGQLHVQLEAGRELARTLAVPLLTQRYSARRDDALWQLRWRIDRLPNVERYDGAFQALFDPRDNGPERELRVLRASFAGSAP
jgi:hypothetical protein